jgi:hypothetical protein
VTEANHGMPFLGAWLHAVVGAAAIDGWETSVCQGNNQLQLNMERRFSSVDVTAAIC